LICGGAFSKTVTCFLIGAFRAKMLTSYIAKIGLKDAPKIEKAIQLVEENLDLSAFYREDPVSLPG